MAVYQKDRHRGLAVLVRSYSQVFQIRLLFDKSQSHWLVDLNA